MRLINISVARAVTSFTALGILFYIGIVVDGTSSYERPFQTPTSIALRHLRDSGMARKFLTSLAQLNVISLTYATRRVTQKLLVNLSARRHLAHPRHLDGCPAGVGFGIPSRLRNHAISILLGTLTFRNSQCGQDGRTPNHRSTSPD